MDLPFNTDLHTRREKHTHSAEVQTDSRPYVNTDDVTSCEYLCRWGLQRVVVKDDALQLCKLSVTDGDGRHFVTGEVETHQRQLRQL